MKFLLLIIMIIASACNKDKYKPDFSSGKLSAFSNGKNWEGEGRGVKNNKDSLYFDMSFNLKNSEGENREAISLMFILPKVGLYHLKKKDAVETDSIPYASFYLLGSDGDAIIGVYTVVNDPQLSFLNVVEFDESTKWVSGTFSALFVEDPRFGKMFPDNPDTIKFENGVFDVRLEE